MDNIPNQACLDSGQCDLEDIEAGFSSIIELMLGVLGAMALFYFIWGAIQWLTSGGNQERITKGKNIMIGTSMAIFVTLGSYLFVDFFINDVLDVKPGYEVSHAPPECEGENESATCNTQQSNYVCSGTYFGDVCLTKCDLYNAKEGVTGAGAELWLYTWGGTQVTMSFSCADKPDDMSPGTDYVVGLCPGAEDNVCLMSISQLGVQPYNQDGLNIINTAFQEFLLNQN